MWEKAWENHQKSQRSERRYYESQREKIMADPSFNGQFVAVVDNEIQGPYHDRDLAISEGIVFADSKSKRVVYVTRVGHEQEEEEGQKELLKKMFQ